MISLVSLICEHEIGDRVQIYSPNSPFHRKIGKIIGKDAFGNRLFCKVLLFNPPIVDGKKITVQRFTEDLLKNVDE